MNDWISPQAKTQVSEIGDYQTNKREDAEKKSFIENMPSPNYVLIDAALWESDIDVFLGKDTPMHKSLFKGLTGEQLWNVAPYLISISSNEEFVETIRGKDPIERRVTWLYSTENMRDLRKHLRRFLRIKQEDGSFIYFRFYDPYVVNSIFPDLSKEQAIEFFGKIEYIATEDARIGEKHTFRLSSDKELQIISQKLDSHVDNLK